MSQDTSNKNDGRPHLHGSHAGHTRKQILAKSLPCALSQALIEPPFTVMHSHVQQLGCLNVNGFCSLHNKDIP
eukprot:1942331-Karenia_brevis.AAC.1